MATVKAHQVFTTEEIELQDGTIITLRPLPIKPLRRVMAEWKKMQDEEAMKETEEHPDPATDVLVNMGMICLENKKGAEEISIDKDAFEDVVDTNTLFRIIKVCSGIDLETPLSDDGPKAPANGTTD